METDEASLAGLVTIQGAITDSREIDAKGARSSEGYIWSENQGNVRISYKSAKFPSFVNLVPVTSLTGATSFAIL